jgi:hypothetical protein
MYSLFSPSVLFPGVRADADAADDTPRAAMIASTSESAIAFVHCAASSSSDRAHGSAYSGTQVRPMSGPGGIRTIDIHAHCAVPAAMTLMNLSLAAVGGNTLPVALDDTSLATRLAAMDAQQVAKIRIVDAQELSGQRLESVPPPHIVVRIAIDIVEELDYPHRQGSLPAGDAREDSITLIVDVRKSEGAGIPTIRVVGPPEMSNVPSREAFRELCTRGRWHQWNLGAAFPEACMRRARWEERPLRIAARQPRNPIRGLAPLRRHRYGGGGGS